jgi:predicted ATPase
LYLEAVMINSGLSMSTILISYIFDGPSLCPSFSHDRYVQAAAQLRECADVEKMHFIIVQTIMKYSMGEGGLSIYVLAQHICQAVSLIKRRTENRRCYRDVLVKAAKRAIESGARPTALKYYKATLDLMQAYPWDESAQDVFYEETLDSHTAAAELYWHQGRFSQAQSLLASIFTGARTAADKAPAWIIRSRIQAAQGNISATFTS